MCNEVKAREEFGKRRKACRACEPAGFRLCPRCSKVLPESDFSARTGRGGLHAKCRPCAAASSSEWQRSNPEAMRAIKRASRLRHPPTDEQRRANLARAAMWKKENMERVRETQRLRTRERRASDETYRAKINARSKEWRSKNPEWFKSYEVRTAGVRKERARAYREANKDAQAEWRLAAKYGITVAEWEAMFDAQGRRCGCCGTGHPGGQGWATDHCHVTGVVRGILCLSCNTTIGRCGDDIKGVVEFAEMAVQYLSKEARGGGHARQEAA